jgi:hypothetical protein
MGNALENAVARLAEIERLLSSMAGLQKERADLLKSLDCLRQYGEVPGVVVQAENDVAVEESPNSPKVHEIVWEVMRRLPGCSPVGSGLTFRRIHDYALKRGYEVNLDSLRRALGKKNELFERTHDGTYRLRSYERPIPDTSND